jgi:hypothetical protein
MRKLSSKEAEEIINKERQERIKRAGEKIQQALKEENCDLDVSMVITTKGNYPQINIVANAQQDIPR